MKRYIWTTLLLTCLIVIGGTEAATAPDSTQAKAKEAELAHLRNTIQELSNSLGTLRNQHQEARAKLLTLNQKINKINQALHETEEQRDQLAGNLMLLQHQRKVALDQLVSHRQALAQQLRAAYLLGEQNALKLLLNATEPAELQRGLKYYDYFYRRRGQQIASIKANLLNLNLLEQTIQGKQQKLGALLDYQRSQRESLEQSRHERNALLADLNRDIENTRQRLSQMKEDEQSLQELVKRLRRALTEIPFSNGPGKPFAQLKGQLRLPTTGNIAVRFGAPRQNGLMKWQGIILDAADGTDVSAVAAGRVVFADWLRGFGLLLILDHGNGYMSLYGYNQGLRKNVGDSVKVGEIIATVGNSGGRGQPGLYFEIRHQGTPVDPLVWCKVK